MSEVEQIKALLNDEQKFTALATAAFNEVDADKSGKIDASELETLIGKFSGDIGLPPPPKEDVDGIFAALDTDQSGTLTIDEFKVLIRAVLEALVASESDTA